jgi:hypothetical protein
LDCRGDGGVGLTVGGIGNGSGLFGVVEAVEVDLYFGVSEMLYQLFLFYLFVNDGSVIFH